jgi:ADP-ribose pyrophosphatase YjhB (NUDIX family)
VIAFARATPFCPQCGAPTEIREIYGRERPVCPVCGFIQFRNPTPVAGCVVEHGGGIVLIQRGVEPGLGLWGLPAGYMEWGESAEEAAARETLEETGLIVRIERLIGVYSFGHPLGNGSGVLIFYVATAEGGILAAGDDAMDAVVYPPDALPEAIAFPTHRHAIADYLAHRQR